MDAAEAIFREEVGELLAELEGRLLELEKSPADRDQINGIFRALHTIKGSGAMFGFNRLSAFAHEIETAYDRIRNGQLAADKELIDLTLAGCDQVRALLDPAESDEPQLQARENELRAAFQRLQGAPPAAAPVAAPEPDAAEREITWRIRLRPRASILRDGLDLMALFDELSAMGDFKVIAQAAEMPALADIDPDLCYLSWDMVLTTRRNEQAVRDALLFAAAGGELSLGVIDDPTRADLDPGYKKLGEILVERGDMDEQEMARLLQQQKRFGELATESGTVTPDLVASALLEQQHVREMRARREQAEAAASIRVSSVKVDRLVDLVGELVTVQARLSQVAARHANIDLVSIAEAVERLIAELRDNAMEIRMLPIGSTFAKFNRLVRDLSGELGKEVQLLTEGGDTELDKTVIEKLGDPLVHLIRNAVGHGIEPPEKRAKAGKPRQGTITLAAEHSGASVLVRVRDDGAGLDAAAIRAKALEKGLIHAQAELSEQEIFNLIFLPGFSTAESVTGVSGRGVGMDVVKRNVESLRGAIEVQSRPGAGTDICLRLPLTLAIIDGLLVRIGAESFIVPLALVEECLALSRRELQAGHGRQVLQVRGEIVSYIGLADFFAMEHQAPEIQQAVICRVEGLRVGLLVDKVVGQYQTVIKPLSRFYKDVRGLSGASILGDGTVALILDPSQLARLARDEEGAALQRSDARAAQRGGA